VIVGDQFGREFLLKKWVRCTVIGKIMDPSTSIRGWTSLVAIVVFLGGIQLLSVGVIGIYIGKIYKEVKGGPLYIIDKTTNFEE